jgi:hypothetical protein
VSTVTNVTVLQHILNIRQYEQVRCKKYAKKCTSFLLVDPLHKKERGEEEREKKNKEEEEEKKKKEKKKKKKRRSC